MTTDLEGMLRTGLHLAKLPPAPDHLRSRAALLVTPMAAAQPKPTHESRSSRSRPLLLLPAAAIVVALVGLSLLIPGAAPPTVVDGLPVLSVSQILAQRAAGGLRNQPVAVGGYWSDGSVAHSCGPPQSNPGVLELYCRDGEFGITELNEPIIVIDRGGYVTEPQGPHLTPYLPSDVPGLDALRGLPIINGQRYLPVPIVVVGHFDDPGAAQCRAEARQLCMDRLVVDKIAYFNPGAVATPGITPSPTPFPSPGPPGLFGPERCAGDVAYSFVGWTTTDELHLDLSREGHVWAMVTRDVIKLTEDGWQDDPNGTGHRFQIWGRKICLAEEDPHRTGEMSFSAVPGSTYVLWDDGSRTPGENPIWQPGRGSERPETSPTDTPPIEPTPTP